MEHDTKAHLAYIEHELTAEENRLLQEAEERADWLAEKAAEEAMERQAEEYAAMSWSGYY